MVHCLWTMNCGLLSLGLQELSYRSLSLDSKLLLTTLDHCPGHRQDWGGGGEGQLFTV